MDENSARRATAPDLSVRGVLSAERARTLALCLSLRHDLESMAEAQSSSNADDEHDPEGTTLAFERAQTAALLDQSRSRLDDLEGAIQRHDQGSYGICETCGEAIPMERLAARPAARTCLRCATRTGRPGGLPAILQVAAGPNPQMPTREGDRIGGNQKETHHAGTSRRGRR